MGAGYYITIRAEGKTICTQPSSMGLVFSALLKVSLRFYGYVNVVPQLPWALALTLVCHLLTPIGTTFFQSRETMSMVEPESNYSVIL